ncbi:hypothetical protein OIV83_005857 [Microbotryomycetes sp. JL201]|nr:hypothetical protein OIV83_005857 [Microbotryomycetes sp. JL201]
MDHQPDVVKELTHPRMPSFKAFVLVNGQRVNVYNISQVGPRTTVGYIEASDDQEFEIGYESLGSELHKVSKALDVTALVDDTFVDARCFYNIPGNREPRRRTIDGFRENPTSIRPFKFGTVALTDDEDRVPQSESFHKNVGTIQLKCRRLHGYSTGAEASFGCFEKQSLHEASKKARLSHQAELGASKHSPDLGSFCTPSYIDHHSDKAFAVIEFRYCSRFLLEIGGHLPAHLMPPAPATPPPPAPLLDPTRESDDESSQSSSELSRLRKRVAELERSKNKKRKIKRERAVKPEPGEVVVLD